MAEVTTGAMLTGSHVYGIPHAGSDIDLVVLLSAKEVETLCRIADPMGPSPDGYPGCRQFKLGVLNLIATSDPDWFEAWREGTEHLCARAPVLREQAVEVFKSIFAPLYQRDFEARQNG